MEKLRVHSGHKLFGEIEASSSKNALLPIISASVMCEGEVILKKVPDFIDIKKMFDILRALGSNVVTFGDTVVINSKNIDKFFVSHELGRDIRGSIVILGALLSRFKKACVSYPGGCNIGARPIDLHLKGLKTLGVRIVEEHGYLYCNGENMKPATVVFEKQSVGATENLIMASVFLKGTTILKNAAKEPEVADLANFLNSMGANIQGAGTSTIKIYGVDKLHSTEYRAIGDRIIAGTYLVGTAITGGKIEICNINPEFLKNPLKKLSFCGCNVVVKNDRIKLSAEKRCNALKSITTGVYPKFPTDLQSIFLSLMAVSKGTTYVYERLFDGRFKQVPDLVKMGAKIDVNCMYARVKGIKKLSGADVLATDLRAGAGLVLAGLNADGYTTIENVHLIDRGYNHIEKELSSLGAEIERIEWRTKD